jgi:elongation factor P
MDTSELKNGAKVLFDGAPWVVLNVDFVKPGKGQAFYKIRVTNLLTRNTLEKTLRSGEKVESADVSDVDMEYLYHEGQGYVFMDSSNYEQVTITDAVMGDTKDYLLENMNCSVTLWNGDAIAVRLPNTVTLEVVYTEPAIKGDTQSRVLKPAKLNTGGSVNVPIFIDIGEKILVNTQTREYAGRVSK